MTIAEQLTTLNNNLATINREVGTQENLIRQIKKELDENIVEVRGSSQNAERVYFGTVITNSDGEAEIPYPGFTPTQMILWNIGKIDQTERDDYDDSFVRYLYEGIMLCAVRIDGEGWISQYMGNNSGVTYIAQASANRAPYPPEIENSPNTNIIDDGETICWAIGSGIDIYEDSNYDYSEVEFNYVLVGN